MKLPIIEDFDWDAYEQTEQAQQAKQVNQAQNLEDAIKTYNRLINKKKKNIARLKKNLQKTEQKLKQAKEAQRAEKINSFLKENKGKRVIIEWSLYNDEEDMRSSAISEDIQLVYNNECWIISSKSNEWAGYLSIVERIYIEVEI